MSHKVTMLPRQAKEKINVTLKGGAGSGHHGHAGRPGKRGGSLPGKGGGGGLSPGTIPSNDNASRISLRKASAHLNENIPSNWFEASDEERATVKKQIVSDLAEQSGLDESEVNFAIRQWAETSNDESAASLGMQMAVADEFGAPLSDWQKSKIGDLHIGIDKNDKLLARAMYDNTQAKLRAAGFSSGNKITLFRGFGSDVRYDQGEHVDYFGNAIESWSLDSTIAGSFAGGGDDDVFGVVISMEVPIENILSTARTGFGAIVEAEFVIFGNIPDTEVEVLFFESGSDE